MEELGSKARDGAVEVPGPGGVSCELQCCATAISAYVPTHVWNRVTYIAAQKKTGAKLMQTEEACNLAGDGAGK